MTSDEWEAAPRMHGLQYTRITLFRVLWFATVALFVAVGLVLGLRHLGTLGAIVGGVVGFVVGSLVGSLPSWVSDKLLFRWLQRSSSAELRSVVAADDWKFCHTMALLQLAARGEEVRGELPRILSMLESDSQLRRVYGWDALRIVFPKETRVIEHYNPRESTEACRNKAAGLRAAFNGADASESDL